MEILPKNYPWKIANIKNCHRFRFKNLDGDKVDNMKNKAFVDYAFSILNPSSDENKEHFYIANHHFSKAILSDDSIKVRNKALTGDKMKSFDNNAVDGCTGHFDSKNLIINILQMDEKKNVFKIKELLCTSTNCSI